MNWLDVVIIIVAVVFTFVGLSQGFIRTLFSVLGLVVGIVLAGRYHTFFGESDAAQIAAFIVVLVVVLLVANLLARVVRGVLGVLMLGSADKLLGGVFGLILGCLICGAVLSIIGEVSGVLGGSEWVRTTLNGSVLATFLLDKFPLVLALLPSEFDAVREFFQ